MLWSASSLSTEQNRDMHNKGCATNNKGTKIDKGLRGIRAIFFSWHHDNKGFLVSNIGELPLAE